MSLEHVSLPPSLEYSIEMKLNSTITERELSICGQLTGRLVKNYLITPKQGVLITALASASFALIAAFTLSASFVILGLTITTLGLIYYFKDRDLSSKKTRQALSQELHRLPVMELIQNQKSLTDMIAYDLAPHSQPIDRQRYYILLERLQVLFISIIKRRFEFEYRLNETTQTMQQDIESRYKIGIQPLQTHLESTQGQLTFLQKMLEEESRTVKALEHQILSIRRVYAKQLYQAHVASSQTHQSLPAKEDPALYLQLLHFPKIERQLAKAKTKLATPLSQIEDQKALIKIDRIQLKKAKEVKRESLHEIEVWKLQQIAKILSAAQQAFLEVEEQFKAAISCLESSSACLKLHE